MLQRRYVMLVVLLILAVSTTLCAAPASAATNASSTTAIAVRRATITARDGTDLEAIVVTPNGTGPYPGIVFVSSWGLNDAEYLAQASALARSGYVTLSYSARGFWGSGGQIQGAGPADVADVSSAIDWMLANTAADPLRIGVGGISYGAGIGLIASAFDARIRAVVAMSGWADLVDALYAGNTRRAQAVGLLSATAKLFGDPSPELNQVFADYFANRDSGSIHQWAQVRSAVSYLDAINRNRPAIMLAQSYGDSVFAPNGLVTFFTGLAGPKRLELAPGDHAVVEATGLLGLPNHVWSSATRWFDQYLAGRDTGIAAEPPVVVRRLGTDLVEQYADLAAMSRAGTRLGLGAVRLLDGTGPLGGTPTSGWSRTIWAGVDTTADAGVALLTNGLTALTGIQPAVWLPTVNRLAAGVWESGALPQAMAIRGIPRLHLAINPAASQGTVVAYLYDTDPTGVGRLVADTAVSWLAPTGVLDADFPLTAYDVPAGHRVALVVDTVDPLYLGTNPYGAAVTFGGPSWLAMPLR